MQKITSQSKLYWLQWLQHGTLYVFWLQNYIYILLSFLKPRTLIPSKHCIVFFANREKKYFRKILSKQGRRTPGRRLPFTRNECQSVQWQGWHSLFAWIPNFSLFISTAWLNSLLNKTTHDTCDLHNHTSPKQPSRKKSGTEILEIRRSCLSGYRNWRWSRQPFADQLETSTTHRAFDHHMCQGKGA